MRLSMALNMKQINGRDLMTILRAVLWICLAGLGLMTLLSLTASPWWFGDLLTPFRLQWFCGALLLLGCAIAIKGRKAIILATSLTLLNLTPMVIRLLTFPAAETVAASDIDSRKLRLVAVNALGSNRQHDRLFSIVTQDNPDIIVMTEAQPHWVEAGDSRLAVYPYRFAHPRDDNFGLAIWSKRPFATQTLSGDSRDLPLVVMKMEGLHIIAAHPFPPIGERSTLDNHAYLRRIGDILTTTKGPVVIAGDLNASLWSASLRNLTGLGLRRTAAFAYTWPTSFPALAIQIDHIFVRDAGATHFRVLGDTGSDHRPVQVDILPQ